MIDSHIDILFSVLVLKCYSTFSFIVSYNAKCPILIGYAGHAFPGGGFLSLAHDYRLMNQTRGFWCMNEVHLGLFLKDGMLAIGKQLKDRGYYLDGVWTCQVAC